MVSGDAPARERSSEATRGAFGVASGVAGSARRLAHDASALAPPPPLSSSFSSTLSSRARKSRATSTASSVSSTEGTSARTALAALAALAVHAPDIGSTDRVGWRSSVARALRSSFIEPAVVTALPSNVDSSAHPLASSASSNESPRDRRAAPTPLPSNNPIAGTDPRPGTERGGASSSSSRIHVGSGDDPSPRDRPPANRLEPFPALEATPAPATSSASSSTRDQASATRLRARRLAAGEARLRLFRARRRAGGLDDSSAASAAAATAVARAARAAGGGARDASRWERSAASGSTDRRRWYEARRAACIGGPCGERCAAAAVVVVVCSRRRPPVRRVRSSWIWSVSSIAPSSSNPGRSSSRICIVRDDATDAVSPAPRVRPRSPPVAPTLVRRGAKDASPRTQRGDAGPCERGPVFDLNVPSGTAGAAPAPARPRDVLRFAFDEPIGPRDLRVSSFACERRDRAAAAPTAARTAGVRASRRVSASAASSALRSS